MLKLPNVTLVAVTTIDIAAHVVAIEQSCKDIEWGDVKLITDLPIKNIDDWNRAIVFDLRKYIETDFCMLIHADGFVVNAQSWRDEFLNYDFIGAPWPLPVDNYSYRTPDGEIVRVGNSVSLRSKEMLHLPYQLEVIWKPYFGNTNEDGFLTVHNRRLFQHYGARYAPIEVAKWFSRELDIPENQDVENPFAFHMADNYPGRNEKYKNLMI